MKADLTLYRLFSQNGELLYIGMTGGPMLRIFHHSLHMAWWKDVVTITLERGFDSRDDLLRAEQVAIRKEGPRHNHVGVHPIEQRRPQDVLDADAVREIRSSTERNAELAERYGVSRQAIYQARTRRTWKNVP